MVTAVCIYHEAEPLPQVYAQAKLQHGITRIEPVPYKRGDVKITLRRIRLLLDEQEATFLLVNRYVDATTLKALRDARPPLAVKLLRYTNDGRFESLLHLT